ncbi:MAG: sodium:solute symporter family protein [Treponema sp.]|jgi:SSS family solute:Na+ symporter|nr:sodium:solute symporter family protein [Treponema sp.]
MAGANIVVMVLYFALTLLVGIYYGRKKTSTSADFTVGGRSFGSFLLFCTMLATIVGASSVMGYTSWFARRGISQFWFTIGILITNFIYLLYLGPRINDFGREQGGETIGDWFMYRYGKISKILASILIAVAYIAITAFQYLAMATILSLATGIPFGYCLALTTIIVIIYTSLGGLWAVVSTDTLQGIMTLVGVVIMVPLFLGKAGGVSAVLTKLPEAHLQLFGNVTPWQAFASMLTLGLGIVSWPDIWQRMYAAKNKKALQSSYGWYMAASMVITFAVMFIGFASRVLMPDFEGSANGLLPAMIIKYLPNAMGAILLAALIAVIMGTADSVLLVSSIIIEKDLVTPFLKKDRSDKEKLILTKIITAITGVAVLGVLYFTTDMFDLWVMSADITGATLAVPILLGFIWKRPRESATIGSILAGLAGWLIFTIGKFSVLDPIIPGAFCSLVAYLIIAFIDPNTKSAVKHAANNA